MTTGISPEAVEPVSGYRGATEQLINALEAMPIRGGISGQVVAEEAAIRLRALSAALLASQAETAAAYEAGRADGMREAASIVARHGEIGRKILGASQDLGTATIGSSIVARCDMIGEAILAAIQKGKDHERPPTLVL